MCSSFSKKRAVVAQFGGPTAVINRSLVGAVNELKKHDFIILGPRFGINGVLKNDFFRLDLFSDSKLDGIRKSPGSYLGTSKFNVNDQSAFVILESLKKLGINYFFVIGGDSTGIIGKQIKLAAKQINYELVVFHIPKTIDNDVLVTDHTPGFGSAARLIAKASYGIDQENRSSGGIYGMVIMGRDSGFLAYSSTLLRDSASGPDLIYGPEINFNLEYFLKDIEDVYSRKGRAFFVVSEGIRSYLYENNKPVYENNKPKVELIVDKAAAALKREIEIDENLGQSSLSAGSDVLVYYLNQILKENFGKVRIRINNLGYLARSFPEVSEIDAREAEAVGKKAVQLALSGYEEGSVAIIREGQSHSYAVRLEYVSLDEIIKGIKQVPRDWIGYYGKDIGSQFLIYAGPLVGSIEGFENLDHLLPKNFNFDNFIKE
ncbi:MAG: diphosphate--fructose-6-phosphate 1-phosphotransferase [Candidatus Micrarchaeota archaeon]|nr:diphosphate--fructose-6-phosphate 1-phosphotransferase [Candidatus Micrarchaeota archaeon]